ncbi:MAG: nicotinate-nucleotide adenylyltransferase [Nitrospinae bacterium]|nr:nicotinate-nucleotide adenylyltransferase [Nitrospinota bacterium]
MKVGIIGGTFDPIHLGHLNAAQEIAEEYALEEVVIIPSSSPPHKRGELVSSADRLTMCRLATEDNPLFSVSDMEIVRGGISYTIDTIREFKGLRGEDCEIFFIIGSDALADIWTWKDTEQLFKECNFVVDLRGEDSVSDIEGYLKTKSIDSTITMGGSPFKVYIIKTTLLDISSTKIRKKIGGGLVTNYLLPQKVEDYIAKNSLYGYNR